VISQTGAPAINFSPLKEFLLSLNQRRNAHTTHNSAAVWQLDWKRRSPVFIGNSGIGGETYCDAGGRRFESFGFGERARRAGSPRSGYAVGPARWETRTLRTRVTLIRLETAKLAARWFSARRPAAAQPRE
jgi:hypothetical protein